MREQAGVWRFSVPLRLSLASLIALPLVAGASDSVVVKATSSPGSIGLVITDWRYALYETPEGKEECPAGFQARESAQFKALPDPVARLHKFIGTTASRGPNGENANYNPLSVEDPLPWSELKTTQGFGVNLDGTQNGHATPKTCQHEKFTSPEGAQIDNQMARVLGCITGWRTTGFSAEFRATEEVTSPTDRHLIEITGVNDEKNDPDVEVTIYKGLDRLVRTTANNVFLPFMSHRIDERYPQFIYRTHGKIVNGELITDPIPLARLPILQIEMVGEMQIHDLTLRLKLNDNGAEGYVAGYERLDTWWSNHSKTPSSEPGMYSPAGLYRALHRYADGYPDASGQCTAISVTYKVKAVRALIVHPGKSAPRTNASSADARTRVPTRVAARQE